MCHDPAVPDAVAHHRFTFGPMGAGKSTELIERAAALDAAGSPVAAFVPAELGCDEVRSRTGTCRRAVPVAPGQLVATVAAAAAAGAAFVDDVHMVDAAELRDLVRWADGAGVDLHLYGLLLDFRSRLFATSAVALESVDEWQGLPVAAPCWCGAPAVRNGRLEDGRFVRDGPVVVAGPLAGEARVARGPVEVAYVQLCRRHWLAGEVAPG